MADLGKGLKAGAVAGVIYGAVGEVIKQIVYSLSWGDRIYYYVFFSAIPGAIYGLILGIIIGLIFAVAYKSLPGTTSIVKGLIISIFSWLIFSFLFQYIIIYYRFYFSERYQITIIADLILFIFFGFLLGVFWDKFGKLQRKCPKCHRVIPKDARLCPYCGVTLEKEQE
ncbi:MAG: zinc ribbon domain-containing protein [Thermoplasmatales archaeon]|nr:MAG: zinc ribbon domain-containing protein [Thermoplasmatales archaeon]